MTTTHNRIIAYAALGLAGAALALSVTHAGPAGPVGRQGVSGPAGPAGQRGVSGPAGQVSTQDGICYDATLAPYFYSPTDINGVESCYGGQFITIVPQPQQ